MSDLDQGRLQMFIDRMAEIDREFERRVRKANALRREHRAQRVADGATAKELARLDSPTKRMQRNMRSPEFRAATLRAEHAALRAEFPEITEDLREDIRNKRLGYVEGAEEA